MTVFILARGLNTRVGGRTLLARAVTDDVRIVGELPGGRYKIDARFEGPRTQDGVLRLRSG